MAIGKAGSLEGRHRRISFLGYWKNKSTEANGTRAEKDSNRNGFIISLGRKIEGKGRRTWGIERNECLIKEQFR